GVLSPTGYLPYYGEWLPNAVVGSSDPRDPNEKRYGRFPNPTVHIGLGQLRRIVNELVRCHGPPTEIAIEFTRALKHSPKEKAEIKREQQRNQEKNDARRKNLPDLPFPDHPASLPHTHRTTLTQSLCDNTPPPAPPPNKIPLKRGKKTSKKSCFRTNPIPTISSLPPPPPTTPRQKRPSARATKTAISGARRRR